MRSLVFVFVLITFLLLPAACHQSLQQNALHKREFLDGVPECCISCINQAVPDSRCEAHDEGCYCTDFEFKATATTCFTESCPVEESLEAQKSIYISCQSLVTNNSLTFNAVAITFSTLDVLVIFWRFVTRRYILRQSFGADDWLIFFTFIIHVSSTLATVIESPFDGQSSNVWAPTLDRVIRESIQSYINTALYYIISASLKLAFLLFYLRIFPSASIRRLLWGTVVLTCAYGIAYVLASIFQCTPIEYAWHRYDPEYQGKCIDTRSLSLSHAGLGIALDLWILVIPISQLYQLQLRFWKKISVGVLFSLGILVTIASIVRLERLVEAFRTTAAYLPVVRTSIAIWFVIESSVGILCSSLPTVYCGVVFFFPRLNFWRDTTRRRYSGSQAVGLSDFRRSGRKTPKNNNDDDDNNTQANESRVMIFQQNSAVDVKDTESNDEARLVSSTAPSVSRDQAAISIDSEWNSP